jgi:hypothetical protein
MANLCLVEPRAESEEYAEPEHGATGCCRGRTGATLNPASAWHLFSVAYDMSADEGVTEWYKLCFDLEKELSSKPHQDPEIQNWAARVYALYVSQPLFVSQNVCHSLIPELAERIGSSAETCPRQRTRVIWAWISAKVDRHVLRLFEIVTLRGCPKASSAIQTKSGWCGVD